MLLCRNIRTNLPCERKKGHNGGHFYMDKNPVPGYVGAWTWGRVDSGYVILRDGRWS